MKCLKEWVEKFLKGKLDLKIYKVVFCRMSDRVVIAKLGSKKEKREMMKKKNRLKGEIYIENDVTWEELKTQEKIKIWIKEERQKGEDVKIGIGRVRVNNI